MMSSSHAEEIRKLNELYEDGLFRLVMNDVAEKEGMQYFEESEQLKHNSDSLPPSKSIQKFTKLLDSHLERRTRQQRKYHRSSIFKRAIVAMFGVFIIFSAMMLTVKAFRIQVLDFLISIEPNYTAFQLNNSSSEQGSGKLVIDWTNAYIPTYIPEGYEISNLSYSDAIKKIIFTSEKANSPLIYTEYESNYNIAIDTENASFEKTVEVNGKDGTITEKDSILTLVWEMDSHLFVIQGDISEAKIIQMASGVQFNK